MKPATIGRLGVLAGLVVGRRRRPPRRPTVTPAEYAVTQQRMRLFGPSPPAAGAGSARRRARQPARPDRQGGPRPDAVRPRSGGGVRGRAVRLAARPPGPRRRWRGGGSACRASASTPRATTGSPGSMPDGSDVAWVTAYRGADDADLVRRGPGEGGADAAADAGAGRGRAAAFPPDGRGRPGAGHPRSGRLLADRQQSGGPGDAAARPGRPADGGARGARSC